jgi:chromosome segregation protein
MKKSILGYNVSEVDIMLNTLREENEGLNATIVTLKTQIKNNETSSAKANLFEAELKSREETMKQLNEEKNEFKQQISSLTAEYAILNELNSELTKKIEQLNKEKENLNIQISQFQQLSNPNELTNTDTVLLEELQLLSHKEADELTAATLDLNETKTSYEAPADDFNNEKSKEITNELELAQMEIDQLKEELTVTKLTIDEQSKRRVLEKKQETNLNLASEVSLRAYYDMSKLRDEVVDYMQGQLKEYYQSVNENSVKMRAAIEQRQTEYNQMIREFITKASDYRVSLSSMEDKYNNMTDYSLNIDQLSNRMNAIMNDFIDETNACLKQS